MKTKRRRVIIGALLALILVTGGCTKGQQASNTGAQPSPYAVQVTQIPLPGSLIPQFVDPLPNLNTIIAGKKTIELEMSEFKFNILPSTIRLPGNVPYTGTWVWGYLEPNQSGNAKKIPSYIGPVVVATRGTPTEMKFINKLGTAATTKVLAYKNSVDQTLHWADPLNGGANQATMSEVPGQAPQAPWDQNYAGAIPAAVHLHGGEVPPVLDGGPESWFTSSGKLVGKEYYSRDGKKAKNYVVYNYPNSQEAAPIWFHDHTLGATRLNVFAGLAGGYLVVDPKQNLPPNLPGPADIIPLVIQDRMFDTNGQLFFPSGTLGGVVSALSPQHPYWVPEFIGDAIVVNGKAWPYKDVAPKRYRFLFLNGSNARTYELSMPAGVPMFVIGNDGGYLDAPAQINQLVIMPGERYEVIMDFSLVAGQTLVMTNTAAAPYPFGDPVDPATTGRIIQFRVSNTTVVDSSYNPASGTPLRTGSQKIVRLVDPASGSLATGVTPAKTRALTLNEVMAAPQTVNGINYPGGPVAVLVNNSSYDGMRTNPVTGADEPIPGSVSDGHGNYVTETPKEGASCKIPLNLSGIGEKVPCRRVLLRTWCHNILL